MKIKQCIKNILSDIKVELLDEFDKNFERKGFFENNSWVKSKTPGTKGTLLNSGNLRRSIRGAVSGNSVRFSSSLPYASIHNQGGTLTVTTRMKKFFWAKSLAAKESGNKEQESFYKAMALKKVGSKINIPQRQFLGHHKKLEQPIMDIITQNMDDFIKEQAMLLQKRIRSK